MAINLAELLVTQSSVRDIDILDKMEYFVYTGGFWTHDVLHKYARRHGLRTSPLIQISRFEDAKLFLHDGHHRCLGVWGGGREYLRDDEYQISDWKYTDYTSVNFESKWVTPFDPRTHLRLADLEVFKSNVEVFKERYLGSRHLIEHWIRNNTDMYREPRGSLTNVESLFNALTKQKDRAIIA